MSAEEEQLEEIPYGSQTYYVDSSDHVYEKVSDEDYEEVGIRVNKKPLHMVWFGERKLVEPSIQLSNGLDLDSDGNLYQKEKQVGYTVPLDQGIQKVMDWKELVLIKIENYQLMVRNGMLYGLVLSIPEDETDIEIQMKPLETVKSLVMNFIEKEISMIQRRILDLVGQMKGVNDQTPLKRQQLEEERKKVNLMMKHQALMLQVTRSNIANIRKITEREAGKEAAEKKAQEVGKIYIEQKKQFEKITTASIAKIQELEFQLESQLGQEESMVMTQVEHLGKWYAIDHVNKEVYEKDENQEYNQVGTLAENGSIQLFTGADWKEEYADLEPQTYKGNTYMVNPNSKNVFGHNSGTGELEHVGTALSLDPLEVKFLGQPVEHKAQPKEEPVEHKAQPKEEPVEHKAQPKGGPNGIQVSANAEPKGDDEVKAIVMEYHNKKYVRDSDEFVYNGKTFDLVGRWDSDEKEIDFIPTRGFMNVHDSCYMDSVLFALLYRSSPFILGHLLKETQDKHPAVSQNQVELRKLYKWLHSESQQANVSYVCTNFRKTYHRIDKNSAIHDSAFEKGMGDSSEWLLELLNGFGVETMTRTTTSSGKEGDQLFLIKKQVERVAPVVSVTTRSKPEDYYHNRSVTTESKGKQFQTVTPMSAQDQAEEEQLLSDIKLEKVKVLSKPTTLERLTMPKLKDILLALKQSQSGNKQKLVERVAANHPTFDMLNRHYLDRDVKPLYEADPLIVQKIQQLNTLRDKYRVSYSEKIDETSYEPIDGMDHHYVVLSVERKLPNEGRDKSPFDIQETIVCPKGERIQLEFVVRYTDSPQHYICYFKNIQDDLWYVYNDLESKVRLVGDGEFETMKAQTATGCTLLFYNKF